MRYLILITLILLTASCRKDRDCICIKKNNPDNKDVYQISISKKKDAEQLCQEYYETYKLWVESCKLE